VEVEETMRNGMLLAIGCCVLGIAAPCDSSTPAQAVEPAGAAPQCRSAGPLLSLPDLPEASGLAASRRVPGRLWSHNDSGEPVLVALDASGKVTTRLQVSGARVDDWEAVSVGPCPSGSCIHIADIGDNDAERERITIYRIPEPDASAGAAPAPDVFHATYPDGAHDAETLLVAPDGRMYVVTKGETGAVALYRFPAATRSGTTSQLERVGAARGAGKADAADRITDGAVSPDGRWVVLRSHAAMRFYAAADLFGGNWREAGVVDLAPLREPQGEGVAFGADGTVYLAGEGGGKARPGTLARLACR
jgi:hypothetical protein